MRQDMPAALPAPPTPMTILAIVEHIIRVRLLAETSVVDVRKRVNCCLWPLCLRAMVE